MGTDGGFVIDPPANAAIGENVSAVDALKTLAWTATCGGVQPPDDNNT